MTGIEQWVVQHALSALSAAAVVGGAAAWVAKELPIFAGQEIALLDAQLLAAIKDPTVRAFAVKVERAIVEAVPEAGDARYAVLTDKIVADLPAEAKLARPLILAILTGLGTGARDGIEKAAGPGGPAA